MMYEKPEFEIVILDLNIIGGGGCACAADDSNPYSTQ